MNVKKTVTCHAGARDGYYLSAALHELDTLEALVTDFYTPDALNNFLKVRHNPKLPSSKTKSIRFNIFRQKFLNQNFLTTDKILSRRAFQVASSARSNLFLTSYTAFEAFKLASENFPEMVKLLFQIHPHPMTVRQILTEELVATPEAELSILAEHEMQASEEMLARLDGESKLSDSIVVASTFTQQTLIQNGIPPEKITVLPYGVDTAKFPQKAYYNNGSEYLKVLFLGQMVQRKGLSYLLKAIKALSTKTVELTIVGRGQIDEPLLKEYGAFINFNIVKGLSHDALVQCFHDHDVMVLPSLVEGFGHVILEAMSSGLPIICTKNTAGPDLFISGHEGLVVPIRDSDAIASAVENFIRNKGKTEFMGRQAADTAREFTWKRHREGIQKFYLDKL